MGLACQHFLKHGSCNFWHPESHSQIRDEYRRLTNTAHGGIAAAYFTDGAQEVKLCFFPLIPIILVGDQIPKKEDLFYVKFAGIETEGFLFTLDHVFGQIYDRESESQAVNDFRYYDLGNRPLYPDHLKLPKEELANYKTGVFSINPKGEHRITTPNDRDIFHFRDNRKALVANADENRAMHNCPVVFKVHPS